MDPKGEVSAVDTCSPPDLPPFPLDSLFPAATEVLQVFF